MFVNEYGIVFQFGVSFNMSANTSLSFTFTRPDATTITVAGALGTVTIDTTAGIFLANTYATYVINGGDLNQAGEYSVRLTYIDASPARLISSIGLFTVSP